MAKKRAGIIYCESALDRARFLRRVMFDSFRNFGRNFNFEKNATPQKYNKSQRRRQSERRQNDCFEFSEIHRSSFPRKIRRAFITVDVRGLKMFRIRRNAF